MSIVTINNINTIFKDWATSQAPLINSYYYGPLSDWGTSKSMSYPAMWVSHNVGVMSVSNRNVLPSLTYDIMMVDQINIQPNVLDANGYESDNRVHIMSDTYQLCQDFLNAVIVSFANMGISINGDVSLTAVDDETTDKVCGWLLSINLKLQYTTCVPVPTPVCLPAYVRNSDDTYVTTVNSGGNLILPNIKIHINGVQTNILPAVKDAYIVVQNTAENFVGSVEGNTVTIGNSTVVVNGTVLDEIPAETAYPISVTLDGVNSGVWNPTTDTWEVESSPYSTILNWELNFNTTDDIIFIPTTSNNTGTLNSGSGSNVGTITISTDDIIYSTLSFPFTPIVGTTYYFKRSIATVNGTYTMEGEY